MISYLFRPICCKLILIEVKDWLLRHTYDNIKNSNPIVCKTKEFFYKCSQHTDRFNTSELYTENGRFKGTRLDRYTNHQHVPQIFHILNFFFSLQCGRFRLYNCTQLKTKYWNWNWLVIKRKNSSRIFWEIITRVTMRPIVE